MKKSALSAALAGGAPAPAAPHHPSGKNSTFLDPNAFPCIEYADVIDGVKAASEVDDVASGLGNLDLGNIAIVGSAPTNVFLDGVLLADYPLNPRRRRAGQEQQPDVAASLNTMGSIPPSSSYSSNFLSQAVIGSLPKGLTNEDKMRILMSLPMSPSRALLQELSMDAVSSRTVDGRSLRRQVLKGAVMVFVTAGYSGKRFIFEKAKELGVRSVVLDGPDRCAIKDARSAIGELDGITTFCEMAVPLASRLAEKLGLPTNTPQAVDNARDKKWAPVARLARLGLARLGCVVAPRNPPLGGSLEGGRLRQRPRHRQQQPDGPPAAPAAASAAAAAIGARSGAQSGKHRRLQLLSRRFGHRDWAPAAVAAAAAAAACAATANSSNRRRQQRLQQQSAQAAACDSGTGGRRAVASLGFKLGVFHVECKYTSRGARLIEVNCRMGGGPVRDTNLLVWGVDLVEEHLMACAGIPVRPPTTRRPLKQMAEYTINAQKTGHIKHVDFLDKYKDMEGVMYARPLVEPGARCHCVADGMPTWVCELMVVRPDVREAIRIINTIEEEINRELDQIIQ
ncbi:hypothetical protein TSOC_007967 [Tetrabaena socialis]|uniref:ATP-grasp domain-containing protein n=1 Tax=Tetrabaena socialis TaxID=47790 RepID=A0A2J7ZZP1_9CHLO|nr:hypothetical protein TSOC_007967 [Tetrabaena socialis]|eukprot:PNH05740.1 hypothetical protein TSOC_007967 [Tetrabaena socialis]